MSSVSDFRIPRNPEQAIGNNAAIMPAKQTVPYASATSVLRPLSSEGNVDEVPSKLAEITKPKAETARKNATSPSRVFCLLIWLDGSS